MPKKFGTNSKKEEAREREATKKKEANIAKEEAKEAAKWKDDDKMLKRKEDRAKEKQEKYELEQQKKEEKKRLYEEDQKAISSCKPFNEPGLIHSFAISLETANKAPQNKKVTQWEIKQLREKEIKKREKEAMGLDKPKKNSGENNSGSDIEDYIEDPRNRERFEEEKEQFSEVIVASGVDAVLSAIEGKIDKHPEKRIKAVNSLDFNEFKPRNFHLDFFGFSRSFCLV